MNPDADRPVGTPVVVQTKLPGWLFSVTSGTLLIFVGMVILWLGQVAGHVYTQGSDALVIRAVLRMDTDAVAAENLAARLRQKQPDLSLEIVNESMGRSLLALQEPWIAQMPDFEVTPLPTLLEIKHPNLLSHPEQITQFVKELGEEPEVDFVAYNETAHDRLAKLAGSTAVIQSHTRAWLLAALALAGLITQVAFISRGTHHSIPGTAVRQGIYMIIAWVTGVIVYRMWETTAVASGEWQRLTTGGYLVVGLSALVITFLAIVISISTSRIEVRL